MRVSGVLVSAVLFAVLAAPTVAAQERIESDVTYTRTLAVGDYDALQLIVAQGQVRTISFVAQGIVDFYVMFESHYAEYTDPNAPVFHSLENRENAQEFTEAQEFSGRIYVIDNQDASVSGAFPTGPVTYTVTVTGPSLLDQLFVRSCWGWLVLGFLLVGGSSYWLYTAPKAFRESSKQLRAMLGGR